MYKAIIISILLCSYVYGVDTPYQALKELLAGNKRFIKEKSIHPNRSSHHRQKISKQQKPFAAILSCSDSRTTPEIIFDQGLGDLFSIRIAGNVAGAFEKESLNYAVHTLDTQLILVLGHQNCGAVDAVLEKETKEIADIAKQIKPAIKQAKKLPGDPLHNSIVANVLHVVEKLKEDKRFRSAAKKGNILIQGAYYDFDTGHVELLHPKKDLSF